jgi:CBS domain-containing protein
MKKQGKRKVEDFMSTAVISVRETDTLAEIEGMMSGADIRHLPVVDGRNHVVGIVSQRDVLRAFAGKNGKSPHAGEIMTRSVRTVRASMAADQAVEMMIDHKIGSLPVVGDDEQLVGIITETDFLVVAGQALRGAVVSRAEAEA